ncbi:MAG: GTPase HflX [Oscillospiraceae bacterium]|nr:GTPase HflX [Oscillospiraceae bacterium]
MVYINNLDLNNANNPEEINNRAMLAGIITPGISEGECLVSLGELERLADTAGISVSAKIYQNRKSPEPATYLGKGKLEEAKNIIIADNINIVIFDDELSPSQIRNIEDFFNNNGDNKSDNYIEVIDRTMLILEIFNRHAKTSEGKLQVEIAQLRYTMPRLTGKGKSMSRLGGGGGAAGAGARRGSGETKLEVDRRNIKSRASSLEEELKQLEKERNLLRSRREKTGITNIAVAGYTNSGKSTLLNYLTNAGILAENKLFATLDPTTRKLKLPNNSEVLLTDTVGLIKKLPHHLVRAFKSTLDEINYANLILLLCDISDPEHLEQLDVAKTLLTEMGVTETPVITVYNKIDCLTSPSDNNTDGVYISAKTGEGVENLLAKIQETLDNMRKLVTFAFPVNLQGKEQGYINYLYKNASVIDIDYGEEYTTVKAWTDTRTRNL